MPAQLLFLVYFFSPLFAMLTFVMLKITQGLEHPWDAHGHGDHGDHGHGHDFDEFHNDIKYEKAGVGVGPTASE